MKKVALSVVRNLNYDPPARLTDRNPPPEHDAPTDRNPKAHR
ncbi:hypothetical protein FTUN_3682 [Frigoriglobus tundricola]|uniref:Uncharacterized protein n=1 Tax=Frigoriglobus tundricola TaxID=2774151 RepID=A0A6M5YQ09_9BACT|nr:hypothetical protein FTUN_3682 [Frigoriglobus tundricola]